MSLLNFISGTLLGFVLAVAFINHQTPAPGEVWSFTVRDRVYHLTVKYADGSCVVVDQEGIPIALPIDILRAIADES
jgi:hypothetical protein